jgi:cell pole-organizing protein PopZ
MEEEPIARVMPTFFDTRVNRLGELTRQAYEPKKPEPQPEPAVQPAVATHLPPELPEGGFAQHAADSVDDAAAQLLRPMLRQWLQENMPKIVEKALLSEVQGTPTKPRS